ncbi:MAG: PrgI family protein [Candidatus Paceibacterota bacterium]
MQFKVPQFIDIEDKLFGPFTFFQFVYLVGGAGIVFVIYKIFPLWIGIFLIIPVAILSVLLVFYRINGKPFIYYLQAGASYLVSSKLYIWKQRLINPNSKKKEEEAQAPQMVSVIPMTSNDKLRDISWSLDVEGKEK